MHPIAVSRPRYPKGRTWERAGRASQVATRRDG
jgi:hypothetical protein